MPLAKIEYEFSEGSKIEKLAGYACVARTLLLLEGFEPTKNSNNEWKHPYTLTKAKVLRNLEIKD